MRLELWSEGGIGHYYRRFMKSDPRIDFLPASLGEAAAHHAKKYF